VVLGDALRAPAGAPALHELLVQAVNRSSGPAPARARRSPPAPSGGTGRRVLVAEDNEINQFAAIRLLAKLGFEAEVAQDGRQAVEMAARGRYTAIFMDCQMPELDGYKATAAIRRREGEGARTPIIAMTANTMAGDRERCLGAGMDDYLAKPLRLERLAEVCRRWLPAPGAGDPLPARPGPPASDLFDAGVLADFASPAQIASLLTMFVSQFEEGMSQLGAAVQAGAIEEVARTSHRLKGSAATIGAGAAAEVMHAVCRDARVGGGILTPLYARAQSTAAATIEAIQDHLDAADSASATAADTRR
jgi:CheY-like chemotaxis protein